MTGVLNPPKRGGSRKRGTPAPETRIAQDSAQRAKRQGRAALQNLSVGGSPRVDLLPTEVLVDRRQRAGVRRAWLGAVVVAVAVALATGVASAYAMQSEQRLDDARQETQTLLLDQQQYRNVRTTETQTDLLRAAQAVGGSTDIDWSGTLQQLQSSLPTGVSITGVQIDSASPLEAYAQAAGPLQGQRVATLTVDAASSMLPSVPAWLDSVKGLPGFVDANADTVTLDTATSVYTVAMTIHLDADVYSGKYDLKGTR